MEGLDHPEEYDLVAEATDDALFDELTALTSGDAKTWQRLADKRQKDWLETAKQAEADKVSKRANTISTSDTQDSLFLAGRRLDAARASTDTAIIKYVAEASTTTVPGDDQPPDDISKSSVNGSNDLNAAIPAEKSVRTPVLLFEGLTFYFEPNNDINQIRKKRVQAAVAQGAVWSRKLDLNVTHFVVDANISAEQLWKHYGEQLGSLKLHVVKIAWLIECLSHKMHRDPMQGRFKLKGADQVFADLVPTHEEGSEPLPKSPGNSAMSSISVAKPSSPPTELGDEVQQIMQDMQQADQLPFDAEVDFDKFVSFSEEHESLETSSSQKAIPRENRGFACMESNSGETSNNPNQRTIDILQQMATYYDRTGDNWRTLAYRKGITALKKQSDQLVSTRDQALKITGIGTRLADKIEEIVTTNKLTRLDAVTADPDEQVLQLFMGVYGCGAQQARRWMEQGLRSLEDLKDKGSLTANQKVGVEHYDDFQQRIPREEVKKHGDVVYAALQRVNKELDAIIGGSYRRGMPDSGDIDLMIMHPTADLSQLREWVFDNTVPYLFEIGFMKAALATSRTSEKQQQQKSPAKGRKRKAPIEEPEKAGMPYFASSSDNGSKFHGASCLPDSTTWRRIDLLLVPACSRGAALIYFTGNDIFNRSMRLLASRKGMRLNQHGLYKNVMRGPGRVKQSEGELVKGRNERRIFE